MWSLYELGIRVLGLISAVISLFNPKVRHWRKARKLQILKSYNSPILIHCASLGEYLQAKPLIGLLKKYRQEVVISFFSASGYDYVGSKNKYYLPIDTYAKAKEFITTINPKLVVLVRSEFWFNHLRATKASNIPVVVINSFFTEKHYLFRPFGNWFLQQLKKIDFFYTIDRQTSELLNTHGIKNTMSIGDTKVDQVTQISPLPIEMRNRITQGKRIILAGSIEKEDRPLIRRLIEKRSQQYQIILVDHEPGVNNYEYYRSINKGQITKLSELSSQSSDIIYVDTHGVLSSLYPLAWVSYIGGGFGKGIHNILEACVANCPVIFGPQHHKFVEARKLLERGAAKEIKDLNDFNVALDYFADESNHATAKQACKEFINDNKGATNVLFTQLKEKGFI